MNFKKLIVIFIFGFLFFFILTCFGLFEREYTQYEKIEGSFPIYYAEVPNGKIWVDIEGHFVLGCGSIDSSLKETYIIKYLDGNELKTYQADATTNSLIIDGTFKLERISYLYRLTTFFGITFDGNLRESIPQWRIHIPALPIINQTSSWTYMP